MNLYLFYKILDNISQRDCAKNICACAKVDFNKFVYLNNYYEHANLILILKLDVVKRSFGFHSIRNIFLN